MPVVMLKNVSDKVRRQVADALRKEFPELLNELCINRVLDLLPTHIPHAHLDSSPELPKEKLDEIKKVIKRFVPVVGRPPEVTKGPYVIYYGL